MLESVSLENFKCFGENQVFDLGKVNVFAGYNGRGKSSVIQSLLLLVQSFQRNGNVETLEINGDLVQLGVLEDLAYEGQTDVPIRFGLKSDAKDADVVNLGYVAKSGFERQGVLDELTISANGTMTDYFKQKVASVVGKTDNKELHILDKGYPTTFHDLFRNVFYVSADRKGPTLYEEKQDLKTYNPVGKNGENVLNVIANEAELGKRISEAVSEIMDGGEIQLTGIDRDYLVLGLNFKIGDGKAYKSINCGFGYSYILPIVASALTMTSGMLFIENPEAHLHPKAQSQLIKFLCGELTPKNVQIFIETHSEHIINAVRLCVLKDGVELGNNDVSIHFFDRDYTCRKLEMDEDAQIADWPKGFFDQQEIDLSEILKLGLLK